MATTWQLTVDCTDPNRLVEFWCAALGYQPEPPPEGWETLWHYWRDAGIPEDEIEGAEAGSGAIIDPEGVGPRIWFQEVPEPKTTKNRLHVDLRHTPGRQAMTYAARRDSIDAEVARLTGLGASTAYVNAPEGADYYAVTMRDPEGNEFCVA
jgi:hypothetical protein